MANTPLSIRPGEIAEIELPFSEVCMHMRVAGQRMMVELLASGEEDPRGGSNVSYAAQIYDGTLNKMGAPVTLGEAGIFRNEGPTGPHFFHY
jgi:hypothetical protein